MKIQESTLALAATHEASSSHTLAVERSVSFRQLYADSVAAGPSRAESLNQRAQRLLQELIEAIMAALDGRQAKLADQAAIPATAEAPRAAGRELVWQETSVETIAEAERTTVCGAGQVRTCDGREIAFDFSLAMARDYRSVELSRSSGSSVRLQDPLMLSFDGEACELAPERMDFDLDADGRAESVAMAGDGCGFLVFDRNGNGRADNGSELFGAASGDGFGELRQYDSDGNGWIDEADPIFKQLAVWSANGVEGLKQAGVGALNLAAVDAPFSLKSAGNELLGEIRAAGIYLKESGEVGHLQQVDLAVSAAPERTEQPAEGQQLSA